jgi:hypothetical protein
LLPLGATAISLLKKVNKTAFFFTRKRGFISLLYLCRIDWEALCVKTYGARVSPCFAENFLTQLFLTQLLIMKKALLSLALVLAGSICANAQFEKGKKYIGATLSNVEMTYSKTKDFNFGMNLNGGYFIDKDIMAKGELGYGYEGKASSFNLGAGMRYYFERNGIFVGAAGEVKWHEYSGYHDKFLFYTPVEVGYAFFINRHVTVEPSVYYKVCLNEFKDHCELGFKIGFGVYF